MIPESLRGRLESWLLRVWFGPASALDRVLAALASPLALPLSWLVAAVARRRRRSIVRQRASEPGVPVVVVGNLVAGGSGKTPLVAAIDRSLAGQGFRPGLVTSGYRARGRDRPGAGAAADGAAGNNAARGGVFLVDSGSDAAEVGDEALMLAIETGLPLAAGKDRALAVAQLCRAHPECDVIVSDDGLQHVGLVRRLELLVLDDRGLGNGRCLPAGPLREPADRLDSVDALIVTSERADAAHARVRRFRSSVQLQRFRMLDGTQHWEPADFAREFAGQRLSAIAGIARPQRFFDSLEALGLAPQCYALPDHARIDPAWLAGLGGRWILMTSKDAVKCRRFDRVLLARCVSLDVAATPDPALLKWLAAELRPVAHRNG